MGVVVQTILLRLIARTSDEQTCTDASGGVSRANGYMSVLPRSSFDFHFHIDTSLPVYQRLRYRLNVCVVTTIKSTAASSLHLDPHTGYADTSDASSYHLRTANGNLASHLSSDSAPQWGYTFHMCTPKTSRLGVCETAYFTLGKSRSQACRCQSSHSPS